MKKIILWSISGSDCSGGAGIAADLKTGHMLGAEVITIITANTSQNSQAFVAVNPTPIAILEQQYQLLAQDKPPQAIKIGLIANQAQLDWLTRVISELREQIPELLVVFDPVGQATTGGHMSSLQPAQLQAFLSCVDVITPNLLEAQRLCRSSSSVPLCLHQMACSILQQGVRYAVIKGGHSKNDNLTDYAFYEPNNLQYYAVSTPRISTQYSHGGGCSFATALTTFIAQGYLMRDALTLTKAFINCGLTFNLNNNDHYGPFEQTGFPTQADNYPVISSPTISRYQHLGAFPSLNLANNKKHNLGLYPVVDSLAWLEKLLPLGLEIIQLRIKNMPDKILSSTIKQAVTLAKAFNTRLFINDHWALAIQHGAYGVHLGQEDLHLADLEALSNAKLRLGISTHGCYEFLAAKQLRPSYLAIGAIFPTQTKDMTGQIQGIDNLEKIMLLRDHIPVVAIGGITIERAKAVLSTNINAIAVVTAITGVNDYQSAVSAFKAIIDQQHSA